MAWGRENLIFRFQPRHNPAHGTGPSLVIRPQTMKRGGPNGPAIAFHSHHLNAADGDAIAVRVNLTLQYLPKLVRRDLLFCHGGSLA